MAGFFQYDSAYDPTVAVLPRPAAACPIFSRFLRTSWVIGIITAQIQVQLLEKNAKR